MSSPAHIRVEVYVPSQYAKAIVAIVMSGVAALTAVNGPLTVANLVQVAIVVAGAVGTYLVPNLSSGPARYLKAAVSVVSAGLTALLPYLLDGGLTRSAWLLVIVAAAKALGVYVVPNTQAITYRTGGTA